MVLKKCSKCKKEYERSSSFFHRDKSQEDGFYSQCKKCVNKQNKIKYRSNRDHYISKNLRQNYNIDLTTYNKMFQEQQGRCFICGTHQLDLNRKLFVDHNHETNKIRGLLCQWCNSILGLCKENPLVLVKAIKYLRGK